METIRVIATTEHQYYGRRYLPEQEYDCEAQVLPLFEQHGWVRRKDAALPTGQQYRTRDIVATRRNRATRAGA